MSVFYRVNFITPEGNKIINCPDNISFLDIAEKANLLLPYSCRNGSCSSCLGKLQKGSVDQSDQSFLSAYQLNHQFILTCIAYPRSDSVVLTHQEKYLI